MTKFLVIDDEPQILRALRINLFRGEIDGERIGFDDRFIGTSMPDMSGSPRSRTTTSGRSLAAARSAAEPVAAVVCDAMAPESETRSTARDTSRDN